VAVEEDMTRPGDVPNKRGDSGEGEVAEEEQYGKQECSKGGRSDGGGRRRKRSGSGRGCADAALKESEVTGNERVV
jgi:hypothetical protein